MIRSILLASAAVAAVATHAAAAPAEGEFVFALKGGLDYVIDGDVHNAAVAPVADLGVLNPGLAGVAATLNIQARGWDDIFEDATVYGFEVGYGVTDRVTLNLAATWRDAESDRVQVGTADVPALAATLPVFGEWSDYKAWSLDAGFRYHWRDFGDFVPYAGVTAGLTFVDGMTATFTVPGAPAGGITIANARFFDDSTVFTAGLEVGLGYAVTDAIMLSVETGLRYVGDLDGDDTALGGLGLATINDAGERFSVPVTARVTVSF